MTTQTTYEQGFGQWIDAVRRERPLVHNITNLVVTNVVANALLAIGASPVMAHAHEEVGDMASIASPAELLDACLAGLTCFNVAAELTATRAQGPGTFQAALFDELFSLKAVDVDTRAHVELVVV